MDGDTLLMALGLALIIEGLLPFVAPGTWRQAFSQLMQMQDGQLRFRQRSCAGRSVIGHRVQELTDRVIRPDRVQGGGSAMPHSSSRCAG